MRIRRTCVTLGAALVTVGTLVLALPAAAAGPVTGGAFTNLTWSQGVPVPNAHLEASVATVKADIYDISGAAGDCSDGAPIGATTAVDVYNTTTNTFTSGAPIPNARDENAAAAVVGSKIYVVGGVTGCLTGTTVTPVDVLNTKTGTWTTLPAASDLPAGLTGGEHCGAAVGKSVYYFQAGGIGVLNTAASPPSWTVLPPNPLLSPSSFCSAVRVGKTIVIASPGDGSGDGFSQRILVFNPSSDTITAQSELTVPYAEESIALIKGNVVLAGGDFGLQTVQIVSTKHQTVASASPLPGNRDDTSGGGFVKNVMYIVGGESGTSTLRPHVLIGTPN
ncbi:MAG TPA: hypothetical protein VKG43_01050 [Acidimicrobiales bacterium]|nr:hypothetical protein [Acidimicrobiales bacterium]